MAFGISTSHENFVFPVVSLLCLSVFYRKFSRMLRPPIVIKSVCRSRRTSNSKISLIDSLFKLIMFIMPTFLKIFTKYLLYQIKIINYMFFLYNILKNNGDKFEPLQYIHMLSLKILRK